jgi:hypothetical protein
VTSPASPPEQRPASGAETGTQTPTAIPGDIMESGEGLVISTAGTAELAQHPEARGRAREFYKMEGGLAEMGFHSAQNKPDSKRPDGTLTA